MGFRQSVQCIGAFFVLAVMGASHDAKTMAAPFYQDKTLVVVVAYPPGGSGSLRTQIGAQHLSKNLPGHPTVVFKFMPDAGGLEAANYMANAVKKDGLTIANIGAGMFAHAIFKAPGIRFEIDDFTFFGTGYPGGPYTVEIRPELELKTVKALRAHRGLRFGQRSVGHSQYVLDRIIAYVLELKDPEWKVGYTSQGIVAALDRGEVDAHTTSVITFLQRDGREKLKNGYTVPIVIRNTKRRGGAWVPDFPPRPHLEEFADTDAKRAILRFHNSIRPGSTNFLAPRGIPNGALVALREGFEKVWSDPEYSTEYTRLTGQPADPVTGEEIEAAIMRISRDPNVAELYRRIAGPGPLPPVRSQPLCGQMEGAWGCP